MVDTIPDTDKMADTLFCENEEADGKKKSLKLKFQNQFTSLNEIKYITRSLTLLATSDIRFKSVLLLLQFFLSIAFF